MIIKDSFKEIEFWGGDFISANPNNDASMEMWYRSDFPKLKDKVLWANCGCGAWLFYPNIANQLEGVELNAVHDLKEDFLCLAKNSKLSGYKVYNYLNDISDLNQSKKYKQIFYRVSKQAVLAKDQVQRLSHLLSDDGVLYVFGPNREGMKPLQKWCNEYFKESSILNIACGSRVIECSKPNLNLEFSDILNSQVIRCENIEKEFCVDFHPAVFSAKKLDGGSLLLMDNLPNLKNKRTLDLGCGSGVLSLVAAELGANVVSADHSLASVKLTEDNMKRNGFESEVYCSFIGDDLMELEKFDVIITNPPFHKGARTAMDLGKDWLRHCSELLKDDGVIYAVTNSFLRYSSFAEGIFDNCIRIKETPSFVVYQISNSN